ncbi:hypothetical protein JRO89_XS13G0201300 [Xanthoceras sorbifolium]|uniref:Uncharacterized protein n=1 Tax=Xanthoceras sorbifolium TaxID=99658 RepID=A0ABQ8H999_9ROSI|nr:hypothetical protein JRO89_XS13G0201300 [Xanthoceras sorbifolium]
MNQTKVPINQNAPVQLLIHSGCFCTSLSGLPIIVMAFKLTSSFTCVPNTLSSPLKPTIRAKMTLSQRPFNRRQVDALQLQNSKVLQIFKSCHFADGLLKFQGRFPKRQNVFFAVSQDQSQFIELKPDASEQVSQHPNSEDNSSGGSSTIHYEGTDGKPGFISFYNRPYKRDDETSITKVRRRQSSLVWFAGPAVLVTSFIFPSLYLRRILSTVFEDSLLTAGNNCQREGDKMRSGQYWQRSLRLDFLILFFTEALFYSGVAVFLLLIHDLRTPTGPESSTNDNRTLPSQLGLRISSVASLVLSLIIPMVTMGLVWPWTGPAASATLAPYLVGIVVQFAFEQYARYWKSPSWLLIPIIFQVYRLHQLNRAAQLVTALSFTVRGAEMTSHNLAINKSLSALLNVLQLLGVICIWSLSSFLMRSFPPIATTEA